MSVRVTVTNAEIDVLTDLADGDSCADPSDSRYPILMAFIDRVYARDTRPADPEAAVKRNNEAKGF